MGFRSFIIIFLCTLLTDLLVSQESDFIFSQFTTQNGLPSNECHDILQDYEGYIWIATDNGVARFDGTEFKYYGLKQGLGDLVIFTLREDIHGQIWAGGLKNEIYIYDKQLDEFQSYSQNDILKNNTLNNRNFAKNFNIDITNELKIPRAKLGLLSIDESGSFYVDSISSKVDFQIYTDKASDYIVLNSIEHILTESKFDIHWKIDNLQESGTKHFSITNYSDNQYHRNSICRFTSGITGAFGNTLYHLDHNGTSWSRNEKGIKRVQKNRENQPVLLFDGNKGARIYQNIKENKYYTLFSDISASAFLEDRDGGYWVASIDQGLFYIRNKNIKYITHLHKSKMYTHVVSDNKGSIYTASFEGVLEKVELYTRYSDILVYNKGKDFQMVSYDVIHDKLWHSSGFSTSSISEDLTVRTIVNPFDNKDSLNVGATDIQFGRDNAYIVQSGYNILDVNLSLNKVTHSLFEKNDSERNEKIWSIHITQDSQLLVSKDKGLSYIVGDEFIGYREIDSLSQHRINKIVEKNNGNLYYASQGTGLLVDIEGSPLRAITEVDGILSNNLEDITLGDENVIWLASLKGISRVEWISQDSIFIQNYTTSNGLPVPDIYDLEWYDNMLYAATGKGVIELSESPENSHSVSPKLLNLHVNGIDKSTFEKHSFSHNQNNIALQFATINFRMGEHERYRYRINENEWINTKQRDLYLVNLSPNSYKVEIQSQNEDSYWSASSVLLFQIKPAWSKTWMFYVFLALLGSGFIILYFLHRERIIKKENAVQEELRSLEKAALQSQMNPHFIFNCLNSIQRFIMDNDKLAAMDYLSRFAKLIRLTLNASTEREISIYEEVKMLEYYLGLEKMRFKNKFTYDIIVEENVDRYNSYLSPLLIQPLVENAIKHGMKDIEEGGIIEISFIKVKGGHRITVKDNGHGFSNDPIIENNGGHRSLGMKITSDRLGIGEGVTRKRSNGWTEVSIQI